MGPVITFSGLSSGIDSASIIDQLVAIERRPAKLLEEQKSDLGRHRAILDDITSSLKQFSDAASALKDADDIATFRATSSNEATVSVASSGSAAPGQYDILVDRLARGETTVSNTFATADGPGVAGSIEMTIDGQVHTVNYGASDTLYDIASAINGGNAPVNALVLDDGNGGYRLMVTSVETGDRAAIGFVEGSPGVLGLDVAANELVTAQNARIFVNGIEVQRPTNVLSDVFPGITLTLHKVTGTDPNTKVKVERDAGGTRAKLQELVNAYNSVIDALNRQLEYNGVTKGADTLFGDSTLQGLQRRLGDIVTRQFDHNGGAMSLGFVGVELDNRGRLSIDASKFDALLGKDAAAIEDVLAGEGGAAGVAQLFIDTVSAYTRSGDGILVAKTSGIDSRVRSLDDQIGQIENRAASLGERLRRQFSTLEEVMVSLQNQQSYLASFFV